MASAGETLTVDGLRAHLSRPGRRGKGGVLVLPTIVGIEEHMYGICEKLNDAGLLALVWDPFSAYPADTPLAQLWPIARDELDDRPAQREQMRWVGYMQRELGVENVGTIGFCLGGRMVFTLAAADPRIKAVAAYHPSIEHDCPARHLDAVALARDIACPVQVMYPGRDHITKRETFVALREALESRPAPTIAHLYPECDHGFMEHSNPISGVDRSQNPANREATRIAWAQTAAFFQACLL